MSPPVKGFGGAMLRQIPVADLRELAHLSGREVKTFFLVIRGTPDRSRPTAMFVRKADEYPLHIHHSINLIQTKMFIHHSMNSQLFPSHFLLYYRLSLSLLYFVVQLVKCLLEVQYVESTSPMGSIFFRFCYSHHKLKLVLSIFYYSYS